ncbi:hypothetical protein ACFOLJ_12010 [Rugamonas sp. CCM 8940]|uniref:hypothetical protein n=1 Tax=Rugamonas sp. CCM 8940 TaxID=2765359 RepID=UPI0018F7C734|nr:hypothetical protein [Rugamonas sp. CCM 8940]MBJ7311534.1 hypothetical protein [Rugamonas sp. CCM 8940]
MIRQAIFLLGVVAVQSISAAGPLPKDVRTFVKNAEACEHMAGEWDSELPKSQRREITRAIKKYCAPAKQQLPLLTEKYKESPQILRMISEHAYDSVKSYTEIDAS